MNGALAGVVAIVEAGRTIGFVAVNHKNLFEAPGLKEVVVRKRCQRTGRTMHKEEDNAARKEGALV
jgi:hypothetical protein